MHCTAFCSNSSRKHLTASLLHKSGSSLRFVVHIEAAADLHLQRQDQAALTSCDVVQELKILECLAYDENVVQFYGSYVRNGDVQLVLEYMEVGL